MTSSAARYLALGLAALSPACSAVAPSGPMEEAPIQLEAGFLEVPARDVSLQGQPLHIGAAARLFYNLRPADEGPEDRPIFVLFNGFAAEIVRAFGTGPTTVAEDGSVVANPSSLTRIANLLYVDPRQAGFSYDVSAHGAPAPDDCGSGVFNEYVDAADVLLAVLAFLDGHPGLRGPVYWVGESYAGVRVQWILAYLRGRFDLASYRDATLEAALAKADSLRRIHAGQILLQGWLAGSAHGDAIRAACSDPAQVSAVSASAGAPCPGTDACACADTFDRSLYNYSYTVEHQSEREMQASEAHVDPRLAEALLGVPLGSIARLRAGDRDGGFKCSAPDEETPAEDALVKVLGALPAGQAYYVPFSPLQPGKETAPTTRDWETETFEGMAFVDNLRDVPAFLTDGRRDLVVPERALVPALKMLFGDARVHDEGVRVSVAYPDGERGIDIGTYPSAGHMVTMIAPEAFASDVTAWLAGHRSP